MPIIHPVSTLAKHIKDTLERDADLRDVWVSGEVSRVSRPASGHTYFGLRDDESTLRCVMFRNSRGAELLRDGAAVILHGRVTIYAQRGDLQIIADIAQPEGVGELQLQLEQLKFKLEQEGLFDPSRKRELPKFPSRIAVVTSPSGSVWHDIQNVIHRRYPLAELAIAPAPVQGEDAAPLIAEALDAASREPGVDVIILARGGGSLEDLWAFNEEAVARAIYACAPPVVSAVGHETDHTLADLVADRRAPTPSAAAELVVPDSAELMGFAIGCANAMNASVGRLVASARDAGRQMDRRLQNAVPDLDTLRLRVDDRLKTAASLVRHDLALKTERSKGLTYRLESLSPKDTLRRGYAIVQRAADGKVVGSRGQAADGDAINITLADGVLDATVTATKSGNQERQ